MLFYDNFERICREKGTSPSGACVAIGKNKTTSNNWKRNNTIPSEDILADLADLLGCEIADFFATRSADERFRHYYVELMRKPTDKLTSAQRELRDTIAHGAVDGEVSFDEFEKDFLRIYKKLGNPDRAALMGLVYSFAEEKGVEL